MNLISHFRKKADISQRCLAEVAGWTQPRLANYESGSRTPGLTDSRRIVWALNKLGSECSLDEVFPCSEMSVQILSDDGKELLNHENQTRAHP